MIKKLKENNILTVAIPTTFYSDFYPVADIIGFIRRNNKFAGPYRTSLE